LVATSEPETTNTMFPPLSVVNAGYTLDKGKTPAAAATEEVVGTKPLTASASKLGIDEVAIVSVFNAPGSNLLSKLIEAEVAVATVPATTDDQRIG
jgi:hypothetical protein